MPTSVTRPYSSTLNDSRLAAGSVACAANSAAGIRPPTTPTISSTRTNIVARCVRTWREAHEPSPIANR